MRSRAPALAAIAVVMALIAVFPIAVTDPTATSIAVFTLVFMVSATAWNVFSGYSGYLALGHAVFFGTGGYAVALAARDWHVAGGWPVFALLPFGGLVAGLIAIPVGLVALRTRRHTFVVVTIAIFFIFQLAATNLGFTGGTSGILLPIAPFSAANFNQPFYYVAYVILIVDRARLVGHPALAPRPPAAGDPRRRGPRARAWRQDAPAQAHRLRHLGGADRHGRGPVLLFRRPDLSPVRV